MQIYEKFSAVAMHARPNREREVLIRKFKNSQFSWQSSQFESQIISECVCNVYSKNQNE